MNGLIIGKFSPLHLGHCYLIDVGLELCDTLYVFLCSKKDDSISGDVRIKWMREAYPTVHVFHITKEIADAHMDNPKAPDIWEKEIRQYIPDIAISYVFASEVYGKALADVFKARLCTVDMERYVFPVSGNDIRENIYQHWEYLADSVKPSFVQIVCIEGNEEKIFQAAEIVGALYIDDKKIISSELSDGTQEKTMMLAKINALKKQGYPLIIYKTQHIKNSMEDEIMLSLCDRQCVVNDDDDIDEMVRWWMSLTAKKIDRKTGE